MGILGAAVGRGRCDGGWHGGSQGISWESTKEDTRVCLPLRERHILSPEDERESWSLLQSKNSEDGKWNSVYLEDAFTLLLIRKEINVLKSMRNYGHRINKERRWFGIYS